MLFLLFLLIAPFTPQLDLIFERFFYSPDHGFYDNAFFHVLFVYGELFGLMTGALAFLLFSLSYVLPRLYKYRKGALTIALTLVIGAGVITNWGFKGHWGRPRPKQITEFGGQHAYRPFWQPDFSSNRLTQKSFPSGHVAMGFYFMSLCLVGKRYRSKMLFLSGIGLCILLGGGLMLARMAQGGHFFSDVLASIVIMWYTARFVDRWVQSKPIDNMLSKAL